jgi:hypothetical protein
MRRLLRTARTVVFGFTTATGGCVSAWASVAGRRISTSGFVVMTRCSVTTSVTGFGMRTTVVSLRTVVLAEFREDFFAVALRDDLRGMDDLLSK